MKGYHLALSIFFIMSSLAAVQADGYYYPPDWTPADGMKNKFRNVRRVG